MLAAAAADVAKSSLSTTREAVIEDLYFNL